MKLRLPPALFIFIASLPVIFSCQSIPGEDDKRWNESLITEAMQLARPGDLLFRSGNSFASGQIRELSETEKLYSHVGIVVEVNGEKKVCSIEPVDDTSPTDSIRYDDPLTYLDPEQNGFFALYRYALSGEEHKAMLSYIEKQFTKGIVFDPVFQYETDDKMYCSEMISKALDTATQGRISLRRTVIIHPSSVNSIVRHFKKFGLTAEQVRQRPVVLIDNVYRHPECSLIKKVDFRP